MHFTVKKMCERFQTERTFLVDFLENKNDFGQWCMSVLRSEVSLVCR